MKNNLILTIISTVVIAGLIGFYSGRFYERRAIKARMEQRQAVMSETSGERKRTPGMIPGMGGGIRH